jgi:hypothetical protein
MDILFLFGILIMGTGALALLCILGCTFVAGCIFFPHVVLPAVILGIILKIVAVCRSIECVHEVAASLMDPTKQSWLSVLMICVLAFAAFKLVSRRYKKAENTMLMFMYFLATCLRMLAVFDTTWYTKTPAFREGKFDPGWPMIDWILAAYVLGHYRMCTVSV